MSGINDERLSSRRYSFLSNSSFESKGGISAEFVHEKVKVIDNLSDKVRKAASFKPGDSDYNNTVMILNQCSSEVKSILQGPGPELVTEEETGPSIKPL